MPWLLLWTVLVLGTALGAFLVGRSLYRSGKAFAAELERAADAFGSLAERAEELAGAATQPAPVVLDDLEPARLRMAEARLRRLARRARRDEYRARAYERWQSFVR